MSFFVQYPPDGDKNVLTPKNWDACVYPINEPYYNVCRRIRVCESSFEATGNSLFAFEALRLATSVKLYPPLWVISYLDSRLRHWHENDLTLDRAFGFTNAGVGKGKRTPPKTALNLYHRNRVLCMAVHKLQGAGLTLPQSCKALASLLARIPEGQVWLLAGNRDFPLPRMDVSAKGLEKAIREADSLWSGEREECADAAKKWSDAEKRAILAIFYPTELPKRIVKVLNL